MTTTGKIETAIERYDQGEVFAFNELGLLISEYGAGAKAISRMVDGNVLKRVTTGKYYKPNPSAFGELKPAEEQLLRTYLFKDGRRIAYITGPALYNRLGLTPQLSKTIQVASLYKRITTKIGNLRVKAVKSYVDVTDENYPILGLLDAVKDFREIPDRNTENILARLRQLIKELSNRQLKNLASLSLNYPPRARALIGALLEWAGANNNLIIPIRKTLNPLSTYNFDIPKNLLPTAEKWKIN